jgi:hypothetical protein
MRSSYIICYHATQIWCDVMFQMNVISKSMHNQNFDMCKSVKLIKVCHKFQKRYEENSLHGDISAVTVLANYFQTEPEFQSVKGVGHLSGHFHYEAHDEPITSENKFGIVIFNTLLNTALMSIKRRCRQLHQHKKTWRFLYKNSENPIAPNLNISQLVKRFQT